MLNPLKILSKFIKSHNQKQLDKLRVILDKVNNFENEISKINDADFPKKTQKLKESLAKDPNIDNILPEAFALVREASKRTRGERHFDVQIMGGIVLHKSGISEMRTGEGKTITIVLAAYLNSLQGKGVHIVTVNDYLAKRDCSEMNKIYNFLGINAGFISNEQDDDERKHNYSQDITYATNSELGFDYLRDNMKFSKDDLVQRGHKFAIVDEIDSCLIDEARTPLVISGAAEDKTGQYLAIDKLVKRLVEQDYEIDEKDKNVFLTNSGISNVEKILNEANILKNNNFYDPANLSLVHHVNQALKATHLYKKGKDYIIQDGLIKIIDELTGRILEGRRYGDGLHQALEAKEKVDIQNENQTLASITYQNYFKLYEKLSGCTGTALTEAEEFLEIYNLSVTVIPTNKKMIRKDWNDQIFRTEKEKNIAIIKKISECYNIGQPTLVFTSSVNKSEQYSSLLNKEKIPHVVLNAKNHEKEAEIIANAGKLNSVIITTSISGRGVDIQLGGKKEDLKGEKLLSEKNKIKSLGGLFVIGTERMESRRVDNQARGRSGRQGDEGNSIFFVSLDDDLMRIFGSDSMNTMLEKGYDQLKRLYKDKIIEKISFKESKNTNYFDAEKVGNMIIELFLKNEFDVCTIFYNKFKNVITQIPQEQQIIPLKSSEPDNSSSESNYEFEPEEDEILSNLLPKNISTQIFKAMLENSASEQGSRMSAMDNATRNAGEMVDKLTIEYNRSRQAAITKELIEIISGAESL